MSRPTRRAWLQVMASNLQARIVARYEEGQEQHACDLGTVPTVELIGELDREIKDAQIYLEELKRRNIAGDNLVAVNRDVLSTLLAIIDGSPVGSLERVSAIEAANITLTIHQSIHEPAKV